MKLTLIYDDDNTQVAMAKPLVDAFNKMLEFRYNLGAIDYEEFIHSSLDILKWEIELKGKRVITSSRVSIVSRSKVIETPSAYDDMIDAILILGECFDMTEGTVSKEWKKNMKELIKLYYQLQYQKTCILHIYDEATNGISGFIALDNETDIIIFPFFLNEDGKTQRIA